ncbi:tetraacyldisaccharide 4'-kinase [Dechloromonas sp. TW-R-39-2]|uniref:tetraacyldisaccharide 4'-kinase n=1 Tax=Dechloromonas sp. TW-R-39-2 TaxID=2654218 RepID=UPI00193DD33A|nr:tetraacyldisaccharide 4'-kinase [Dechloromonas sp. TW-R-39-2]QRM19015.1 tetraacyldisaccharide 4'-kinase [Dechloromonas sp. TW-R-39-2]
MFSAWLQRQWFDQRRLAPALWLLLPLSGLFVLLSTWVRRRTRPEKLAVPVIVIGNITVGGAGKTPLTLHLAHALQQRGWHPGIVSRGYGGENAVPHRVDRDSLPAEAGDEPILLARRSGVPVWVGRHRAAAGRALLAAHPEVDVILCDDGLQHYRLARDVELAVFDGRGAGNGWRLPVGPLREPLSRLTAVDAIICNGLPDARLPAEVPRFEMRLQPGLFYRLDAPAEHCEVGAFLGKKLHALAGIGDPGRFFRTLEGLGLDFEAHPFADHHAYTAEDLAFAKDSILLMTEKDAVKCAGLVAGETWVLPVEAELSPALIDLILEKLRGRQAA